MLRLLFTTRDQSHQLTVVTDGIDSQLNVFMTENCRGDIDYYAGLGIVIEPGKTYNLGTLKEWAYNNALILKSYPEGANAEEIVLSDITETWEYTFTVKPTSLSFVNTGESKQVVVTSKKQLIINGEPEGDPEDCAFTSSLSGNGYSKSDSEGTINVTVTENPGTTVRNGVLTLTQTDSKKSLIINLSQAASTISYNYVFTVTPTSLSFVNTGESKAVTITSTKQKMLNGKASGDVEQVTYTNRPTNATVDGSNIIVSENPNDSERTGSVVFTQNESNKTQTVNLTQAASVITYDYVLTPSPDTLSFVGGGETKSLTSVTSTRQKKLNGSVSGEAETVTYTTAVSGEGFSKGSTDIEIIAAANQTEAQRSGTLTISQTGGKTVKVTLTQAAGVVTYDYVLTPNPTSLSFIAAGEDKIFTVTSTKQKKINGIASGSAEPVAYTTSVTGDGFTKGANDTTVTAAQNTATSVRSGSVTVTQSEPASGAKTATITLSQEAATAAG